MVRLILLLQIADRMNNKHLATSVMLLSAVVAFILACLKYIALLATNSVSIRLNFIDSCMDVVVSLANYFATILSFRKYQKYPHGFDKVTAFAAVMQVVVLLIFAYDSVTESLSRIAHNEMMEANLYSTVIIFISLVLTLVLIYFQKIVIKKTGHLIVYADCMHYMTDVLTNVSMLIYFLLLFVMEDNVIFGNFDAILAIGLSVYIVFCCIRVLSSAWKTLMDMRLPKEKEESVRHKLITHLLKVKDVRITTSRFSGVKECFEIDLIVDKHLEIEHADQLIAQSKKLFNENTECKFRCVSH